MKLKGRFFSFLIGLVVIAGVGSTGLILLRVRSFGNRISTVERLQIDRWAEPRVAIVFGASVYQDELSTILEDRVKTAIELYRAKKIDRIVVSGDNRTNSYNEPKAMAEYLHSHAVDNKDIILDYAGRSTYETLERARDIFGLNRAVLISQRTHLPRALFIAEGLGLECVGVASDRRDYGSETSYQKFREVGASLKAFYNLYFFPPPTILGEKIPIK